MPSTESYPLLLAAAAACEDKKAEDIRILALDPTESGLTDYFLICNGTNERQNVAITDEIELRLKREFGTYPNSVEGRRQAEWILMDYVDFIVHVFSAEKRAFYGLERLRKSATTISVAELSAELKSHIAQVRTRTEKPGTAPAEQPAGEKAAAKKLASKEAVAKEPAAKKPATETPATEKPSIRKPAAKKTLAARTIAPKAAEPGQAPVSTSSATQTPARHKKTA